ncbi:MAG: ChaB family protein [Chroococcales cyanobacterium]
MGYQKVEDLPQDLRDHLYDGAQQIYTAAFNSAESDGMSPEAADHVAWNSVKLHYDKHDDGIWRRKPVASPIHYKSVPNLSME